MPKRLWLDLETFNEVDISVGTYRYAETAEVILFAYAIGDGPEQCWDVTTGEPMPADLGAALADPAVRITAHNSMFDRTVLRLGNIKIEIPRERWRDTMVQAYCHSLPGGLDELGKVLGLPADQRKLKEGRKLIQRFCKPAPRNHLADRYDRHTHPEEWARFISYAKQDIGAMRECARRMPTWNWSPAIIAQWHLDQAINDRGFAVDLELARAGQRAAAEEKERIATRFAELTGGLSPGQHKAILDFLNDTYHLGLDSAAKEILLPMTQDETLPADLREICQLKCDANKTSTAKYGAIAEATSTDGRFRGGLQFAGASRTLRWAGRTFQPQNLPSRGLPLPEQIDDYIDALKASAHEFLFDDLMLYGAAALRGLVTGGSKPIVAADLSNIEGRALAYLAGEEWKLAAFRAYDAGEGPDLYNITATSIIGGDPYRVAKKDRNVFGKVPDLALGYEGGVGALQTFATAYGVRMEEQWPSIKKNVAAEHIARARENYDRWGAEKAKSLEISEKEWVASEAVKLAWRARHPATVALWRALKEAAINAIQHPGRVFAAGPRLKLSVRTHAEIPYLLLRLPSGRFICYCRPKVEGEGFDAKISYEGIYRRTPTSPPIWARVGTYGGKFAENACQAISRDVLAENMPAAEEAGYAILLTIHDEIVSESTGSHEHLAEIMAIVPEWAQGFPLAAAGFTADRYRKD